MFCTIKIIDEIKCQILGLDSKAFNLVKKKLTFNVPGARYLASVKMGKWDGKTSLIGNSGMTYVHLLERILPILDSLNIEIELIDERRSVDIHFDPIDESYTEGLFLRKNGEPIVLRPHQIEAVNLALQIRSGTFLMATGSGKSFTCATIARHYVKHGRVLVIVPSLDLVNQTADAFEEMGVVNVGRYSGEGKILEEITVTTWQSLQNKEEILLDVFCIMTDESHGAKAAVLQHLLGDVAKNVPVRFGFTGTLPEDPLALANVQAMLGEVVYTITSKELQDLGVLASSNVTVLQTQEKKGLSFASYDVELHWLCHNTERLKWVAEFISAVAETGNTLVLVGRIDTGKILQKYLPDSFFIQSGVKSKKRKQQLDRLATEDNTVTIGTKQCVSVGLDAVRVFNVIFFELGRSFVTTIQAVGRGLRKGGDKEHLEVFDLCCNLKHSKKHMTARLGFYKKNEFEYTVEKVTYDQGGVFD